MQKNASDHFPSWIRRALAKQDGVVDHVVAEDRDTLIYLANQACITFHVWLSRIDRVDHPDRMVLDLDLRRGLCQGQMGGARARALLEELGLAPFLPPARAASMSGCRSMVPPISMACASSPRRWRNGWLRAGPGN